MYYRISLDFTSVMLPTPSLYSISLYCMNYHLIVIINSNLYKLKFADAHCILYCNHGSCLPTITIKSQLQLLQFLNDYQSGVEVLIDEDKDSFFCNFVFFFLCTCRLNCLGSMIRASVWTKKSTSCTSFVISYTVLQFRKRNAS